MYFVIKHYLLLVGQEALEIQFSSTSLSQISARSESLAVMKKNKTT